MRGWGSNINGNAVWFSVQGRNKLSVTLDLKKSEDRAKLVALLRRADGLIENFRAGYLERIG
ncbi:MAG: CoA transferase, partial [Alphaproteobacteria bacterium]